MTTATATETSFIIVSKATGIPVTGYFCRAYATRDHAEQIISYDHRNGHRYEAVEMTTSQRITAHRRSHIFRHHHDPVVQRLSETGMTYGPEHPLTTMRNIASATPNPCEGSLGHLRDDTAWEIEDDHRRLLAGEAGVLDTYLPDWTPVRCAVAACRRWTTEDRAA